MSNDDAAGFRKQAEKRREQAAKALSLSFCIGCEEEMADDPSE
jgi:hypothetical protein